ncbi:ferredoxin oxidoreductase [Candidatus Dojkabacteria bacterium]|nr:ferredoxin oxidoreductase [Candidatus Dojkabacteria bacterium]
MKEPSQKKEKQFLQGNVISAYAALNAGATNFFGYPITPSSEIFETWVELTGDPDKPHKSPITNEPIGYLQLEDEMASGFAVTGACLAGKKAFTATAGPGNILMQDAFSAAEALRIPTVALIVQRGGLSTSTVIYSQEEVTLTCFGGNGEGFRIVYSPSGLQEVYNYTIKAFNTAWKYRYPTFVLSDGYQGKMQGEVVIKEMNKNFYTKPSPILLGENRKKGISTNMRNCYDQEEEMNEIINNYQKDFERDSLEIAESETYKAKDADVLIIAHGIVATAAKDAINSLRKEGMKIGLWRPITLRPLDRHSLLKNISHKKQIIYVESALGQMARLINDEIVSGLFKRSTDTDTARNNFKKNTQIREMFRPAIGITPEEIVKFVQNNE